MAARTGGEPVTGATSSQLYVGQVLANRYRIQRQIGHGGMGSVWEAEHTQLGTPVAIKVMRSELAGGEHARARFLREARAAASLRSAAVVQVLDYGVDGDIPYIAMELLQGESLRERLKRTIKLPPQQVASIVEHVCRALTRAHAAGIVHRDLKPDNIFIVSDDEGEHYKVLDFGIAKAPTHSGDQASTAQGSMLGTPYYIAPEQARDASAAEARSDLWSMGVIAYECLLGRRPFDSESLPELSVQILVGDIPVPSAHGSVPEGFDAWFQQATARELPKRFADARELASTLNAVLRPAENASSSAHAVTVSPAPPRRWAAVGLAAATVLGLAWFALNRSPSIPKEPADTPTTAAIATPAAVLPDLGP
ncbi:MAG: serine/threonine protein kinase, partial [Nannocystaceae bacterium]|nr:serine/threonine protein kinase [Nannocystaceae bacterium]